MFDFETKSAYNICIRVTDQGGLSFDKNFVISVNNVNESPTGISLSATSVDENQPINIVVGALSASDPDTGATFTFNLASAVAGVDDGSFNILGTDLRTSAMFDFETKSAYNICIRVMDQGGLSFDKNFVLTVNNLNEAPDKAADHDQHRQQHTETGQAFEIPGAVQQYHVRADNPGENVEVQPGRHAPPAGAAAALAQRVQDFGHQHQDKAGHADQVAEQVGGWRRVNWMNFAPLRAHWQAALSFSAIATLVVLDSQTDTVLLSIFRSEAEVGWYNAATTITASLLVLSQVYRFVVYPSMVHYAQHPPHSAEASGSIHEERQPSRCFLTTRSFRPGHKPSILETANSMGLKKTIAVLPSHHAGKVERNLREHSN